MQPFKVVKLNLFGSEGMWMTHWTKRSEGATVGLNAGANHLSSQFLAETKKPDLLSSQQRNQTC